MLLQRGAAGGVRGRGPGGVCAGAVAGAGAGAGGAVMCAGAEGGVPRGGRPAAVPPRAEAGPAPAVRPAAAAPVQVNIHFSLSQPEHIILSILPTLHPHLGQGRAGPRSCVMSDVEIVSGV